LKVSHLASNTRETSSIDNQKKNARILAAIPCFNTANTISDVVAKTMRYVDEVIVVDDGSNDNTVEVAMAAGAKVISHNVNMGYGAAVKSCFTAFQNSSADILVIIDGDGQHNPDEIPLLLNPVTNNLADFVIGSRFITHLSNMPRYRKFGINVITWLWNFGSKIKVTDTQSGFRVYNKNLLDDFEFVENGMSLSIEILEKIRKNKPIILEIPITCSYENNNGHLTTKAFFHGISVALSVVKIRIKYNLPNNMFNLLF
jgi:glycosyltransferase involved in cell wall biosynthesis